MNSKKKYFGAAVLGEGAVGRVVDYAEMHNILQGATHITMIDTNAVLTAAEQTNVSRKSLAKSLDNIVATSKAAASVKTQDACHFQQVLCDPHNLCTKLESEQGQLVFKVFRTKSDALEELQANHHIRSILGDAIRYTTFHPLTGFKIESPNKPDGYILLYKRGGAPLLNAMSSSQLLQKLTRSFEALHDTLVHLLSKMHSTGWLHCDIKFENILFADPSTHPKFVKSPSRSKRSKQGTVIGGGTFIQLFGMCGKPKVASSVSSDSNYDYSVIDFGLAMSVDTAIDNIAKHSEYPGWGTYICPLLWGSRHRNTQISNIEYYMNEDRTILPYLDGVKSSYYVFDNIRTWEPPLTFNEFLEIAKTEPTTKNLPAVDWYSLLYLYSAIECIAQDKKNITLVKKIKPRMQQVKQLLLSSIRSK